MLLSDRFVKETRQVNHRLVINGGDEVSIAHIMDPRHMFIANALNAVRAKTVREQGRAFLGFAGDDFAGWEALLEVIPGGDGSSGTRSGNKATVSIAWAAELRNDFFNRAACD